MVAMAQIDPGGSTRPSTASNSVMGFVAKTLGISKAPSRRNEETS